MRWSRRPAFAEMFGPVPCAFRFFDRDEWVQFNGLVRQHLRATGYRCDFSTAGEVRLVDEQMTLGLVNLAQECRRTDPASWSAIIAAHFSRIPVYHRTPSRPDELADALRVVLVPDDYLPQDIPTIQAPYAESVVAAVVADLGASVRSVAPSDLDQLRMDVDETWARAWANTRSHAEPIDVATVEIGRATLTVVHGEHFYTASRVRWLEELIGPVDPFGALVALPRRSTILAHVIGSADVMSAIEPLVLNARMLNLEGPRSVSAHVYWWQGGELRWVPTIFDEEDDRVEMYPPPDLARVIDFVA